MNQNPDSKQLKEPTYKVGKGSHGWEALTKIEKINGFDWEIRTMKRSSGTIACMATPVTFSKTNPGCFQWNVCENPAICLAKEKQRATEKSVTAIHQQGIEAFQQKLLLDELPENKTASDVIAVGQVIFTDGLGKSNRRAIYHIEDDEFSPKYHTVNLETLALTVSDHVKNYDQKFGIGTYYKIGDTIDSITLDQLLVDAKIKAEEDKNVAIVAKQKKETLYAETLEQGKILLPSIPTTAIAVIVAHLKKDTSDRHAELYGHSTQKTVYLAYSNHKKSLFSEFRKAAHKYEETAFLQNAPEHFEQRENYRGGRGYYLSESLYSGWEIRKGNIDPQNPKTLEDFQIAAAEGRFFCTPQLVKKTILNPSCEIDNWSLQQTTHSKKGHELFVAAVIENFPKEIFYKLKELAKDFSGYYSRYNRDGAIPGFQFTSIEKRTQFIDASKSITLN